MRRRPSGVFNTTQQMAAVFCGFLIVILLVEARGLETWAERLEIGPLRTVAVRVTKSWRRAVKPLGLEPFRETAIADLQKVQWSDDPVLSADAVDPVPAAAPAIETSHPPMEAPKTSAKVPPVPSPAASVKAPLAANVPRTTKLPALTARPEGRPRVIALTGDSMMTVGLSAVLLRETANRQDIHVVKAFKSGTGLARPEVFDWMRQYPAMLASEHPDIVIVALGANDGQGFVQDGEVLPFGSDKWTSVYRKRLSDFLDMITADGAQVVWMGLPPMKTDTYNRKMETINRIVYTVVTERPQASWWNPTPYIADETGAFREFLVSPEGKTIRIRAADGIHLSDEGAALLISVLMRWIDQQPAPQAPPTGRAAAAVMTPSKPIIARGVSR